MRKTALSNSVKQARKWEPDGVGGRCMIPQGTNMDSGEPTHSHNECRDKPINGEERQDIVRRQSDYSVVSVKPVKAGGEKGIAGTRSGARATSAGHGAGERMSTQLASITQRARENPKYVFTTLAHMLSEDFLEESFRRLKREAASGIDGVTVKEYEANLKENIKDLVRRMKTKQYRPQAVRRVFTPKQDGKMRGLGISVVEDKMVQMGTKRILEAIYEVDFLEASFGFRPKRSCHDALEVVDKTIMTKPINCIVDMDIEKFFDTINHEWLMKCLKQRINDRSLLQLIGRFLKAGVLEEGRFISTDKGTPQGGIISPLLANVYLHYILDLWFEKVIKKQQSGYAQLIRYADDFVVCFGNHEEGKAFEGKLKERLGKFGLKIAESKSRVIEFGRYASQRAERKGRKAATFDFLGFTHYCCKTRKGRFKLGRRTSDKKFRHAMKAMNFWLKGIRNKTVLSEWWKALGSKLTGYYHYYGISGNGRGISVYGQEVLRLVFKWINRRSQKRSYTWEQFHSFLAHNPLPEPRMYHLTYTLCRS
jgi:group II intron reverse transcriptase/maturase